LRQDARSPVHRSLRPHALEVPPRMCYAARRDECLAADDEQVRVES